MDEVPKIDRIAVGKPVLQLTDGRIWQVENGEPYLITQFWDMGQRVEVEEGADADGFTHTLTNVDTPDDDRPVAATQLKDWPKNPKS